MAIDWSSPHPTATADQSSPASMGWSLSGQEEGCAQWAAVDPDYFFDGIHGTSNAQPKGLAQEDASTTDAE